MSRNLTKWSLPILYLLVTGVVLSAQESSIIGVWKGNVTEGASVYSVVIKIERLELQGYAGTTTYTGSANCTGLLTFRRQRAGLYEFDETINNGNGCVNGRMEAYITNDRKLQMDWHQKGRGGDPEAQATLSAVPKE
jgi:hypothetical protein